MGSMTAVMMPSAAMEVRLAAVPWSPLCEATIGTVIATSNPISENIWRLPVMRLRS